MYAKDNPDKFKFTRPGQQPEGVEQTQAEAAWANTLLGEAYEKYMENKMPNQNTLAALRRIRGVGAGIIEMGPAKK